MLGSCIAVGVAVGGPARPPMNPPRPASIYQRNLDQSRFSRVRKSGTSLSDIRYLARRGSESSSGSPR